MEITEEQDWHPADIKAALEKKGWTLGKLARAHGYNRKSPSLALKQPWPRMEQIIAEAIGVEPRDLWPSRYGMDGKPNRRVGRPPASHVDTFDSTVEMKLQREKNRKITNCPCIETQASWFDRAHQVSGKSRSKS